MNPYRERFGSTPQLYVVIHVRNPEQALRNTERALAEGADGVFLIDHRYSIHRPLAHAYEKVRATFPDAWIGLNFLCAETAAVAASYLPAAVDALWTDNPGIMEGATEQPMADEVKAILAGHEKPVLHFGGVAFKHQSQPSNPLAMAKLAAQHLDVVTTSGPATGRPVDSVKVIGMKSAMNELGTNPPLALASGVGEHNVDRYIRAGVDAFLVASSITDGDDSLIRGATQRLISAMTR